MKKLLLVASIFLGSICHAQSGQVIDQSGEPLVGCKVTSLETRESVYTDFDGYYQIDVLPGSELLFEYVSYKRETILSKDGLMVILEDVKVDLLKTLVNQ
tara:strand:+ start:80 stop:379 length:300 start_codon:yes stop_codon:yes gene_type:complete